MSFHSLGTAVVGRTIHVFALNNEGVPVKYVPEISKNCVTKSYMNSALHQMLLQLCIQGGRNG